MKSDGLGFLYMAKFNYFEDCYKIGSSKDAVKRINDLSTLYGPTEIVVCGECKNTVAYERAIQSHLYKHSNKYRVKRGATVDGTLVGPATSKEHFHLDHISIFTALTLFNICCESLYGVEFLCIRPHPKYGVEYGCGCDAFKRISELQGVAV
jgi:hypothetical protein